MKEEAINAIVEKEEQICNLKDQLSDQARAFQEFDNIDEIYQENHGLKEQLIQQRDQQVSQVAEYEKMIEDFQKNSENIAIKYNQIQQEYIDLETEFNEKQNYLNQKEFEWLQENQVNSKLFESKTQIIENQEKEIMKIKEQHKNETELLENQITTFSKIIKTLEQKSEEYVKQITQQNKQISQLNDKMHMKKQKLKVIQENLQSNEQIFKDNLEAQQKLQSEKNETMKQSEQFTSELIDNFNMHIQSKNEEISNLKHQISLLENQAMSEPKKQAFKQKYEQLSLKKELEGILNQNTKQKNFKENKVSKKEFDLFEDALNNTQYDELIANNEKLEQENVANQYIIKRLKDYIITTDERWATENNSLRDDYNAIVKQNLKLKAEFINLNDQLKFFQSTQNKPVLSSKIEEHMLVKSALKPSTTKAKSKSKLKSFFHKS